ncbi:hypothetical protein BN14_07460 [Rhizoctonia solani AG-1 IB]|uniref:Chromo domain-containing protein n=1 Tax=Thanatephorus cucumeris (strain AG1-IB / isolate 7/3/14) TaxID=1108050 RepID=M5C2X7_THACB|nr:hypothetical protein BN14_07460 [Rhizoctonia solani AG-1 IB]
MAGNLPSLPKPDLLGSAQEWAERHGALPNLVKPPELHSIIIWGEPPAASERSRANRVFVELTPSNVATNVPEANKLADNIQRQWEEIAAALRQSKTRLTEGQDTEVPISFEIGEEAWLNAKNINLKTKSDKLTEQRLGPFKVHNVFYVGLLSKVKRNELQAWENQPPPITVDGEEEYKVEGIMDLRETKGKWEYLIKWKGYGPEESTWEPKANLKNAAKHLKKYEEILRKKSLNTTKGL